MTATIPELLERKRWGGRLDRAELERIVLGHLRGEVPDYQLSALLMAACCHGLDGQELADLTEIMADSGHRIDLSALARPVVDKHSTGGVGDKVSLIVVPLVAALGVPVAKLSGRGLGFTGGTLDKLESFPGFSPELSPEGFVGQIRRVGAAIAGQSADLAPADGKLYALRDVTGTVGSVPLIASSVMSKKLAGGAPSIVLDVKQGRGAFMRDLAGARQLTERMVEIGAAAGRRVTAFVSDMDRPLGRAVGNAIEVREAVAMLRDGSGDARLIELVTTLAAEMLRLGGLTDDPIEARARAEQGLRSGIGIAKLAEIVAAQGGDPAPVDDPDLLPTAPVVAELRATRGGVVADVDPMAVALTANRLGAGRAAKSDPVDHAVGIVLRCAVGDAVAAGDVLAEIHARREAQVGPALETLGPAIVVGDAAPRSRPIVLERVSTEG